MLLKVLVFFFIVIIAIVCATDQLVCVDPSEIEKEEIGFFDEEELEKEDKKCGIRINEINVKDPEYPESKEFIELKYTCAEERALRGYKLLGIKAGPKKSTIELVVTLWNAKTRSNGYFTIGGSRMTAAEADLRVPDPLIKFRRKGPAPFSNWIDNGNEKMNAIALIYAWKEPFNNITLTEKKNCINLNDDMIETIKNNLVDMVVFTSKRHDRSRCDVFEQLHPSFVNRNYILRELPTQNTEDSGNDITLNRCADESGGFIPEKIKLGKKLLALKMIAVV